MLQFINRFSQFTISTALSISLVSLIPAIANAPAEQIATAPTPPHLVPAKLNGKSISVLYMTRSGDRVLVRCYPGEQPRIQLQTRADGFQEGILTCNN